MKTQVQVTSDRDENEKYTIFLNDGAAYACTCPAGEHNRSCKHRLRAEAEETFKASWRKMADFEGWDNWKLLREFNQLKKRKGRDHAMAWIIEVIHGCENKFALALRIQGK